MTLDEIIREREALQDSILALVLAFNRKSFAKVTDIEITYSYAVEEGETVSRIRTVGCRVKADIDL